MNKAARRVSYAVGGLALAGLLALALRPAPLPVEVAPVARGALQVTIDEDGETRARDRYVITAPVAGRVLRIELREGDAVAPEQPLARIFPLPLSAREREEQLARIAAAQAGVREAQSRAQRAQADLAQARRERGRVEDLVRGNFVSPQAAERARIAETTAGDEAQAAAARVRAAEADHKAARAALLAIEAGGQGFVTVRSPVAGRVLRIEERSERVVAAGAPLLTVGDPARLELVVDVLSQDAVRIPPGATMLLEGWGGAQALRARVRLVEPLAFTKVSALGVEEQRVNVIGDFVDPPGALGDGFRVEARIVVAGAQDALKLPVSALFREGGSWAVFVVENGRAVKRTVEVGLRNATEAQLLKGLGEGGRVVRYPPNALSDGARVEVVGGG